MAGQDVVLGPYLYVYITVLLHHNCFPVLEDPYAHRNIDLISHDNQCYNNANITRYQLRESNVSPAAVGLNE